MQDFGMACAVFSCAVLVIACGFGFVAGVNREPRDLNRKTYGARDVWTAMCLGVPAIIGAITVIIGWLGEGK